MDTIKLFVLLGWSLLSVAEQILSLTPQLRSELWLKQREWIEDKFCENITFLFLYPPEVSEYSDWYPPSLGIKV